MKRPVTYQVHLHINHYFSAYQGDDAGRHPISIIIFFIIYSAVCFHQLYEHCKTIVVSRGPCTGSRQGGPQRKRRMSCTRSRGTSRCPCGGSRTHPPRPSWPQAPSAAPTWPPRASCWCSGARPRRSGASRGTPRFPAARRPCPAPAASRDLRAWSATSWSRSSAREAFKAASS